MAKRKLSPLMQAIEIFHQLDERDMQTFAEYARVLTGQARPPKSTTAPPVGKRSSRKGVEQSSIPNLEGDMGNALSASGD